MAKRTITFTWTLDSELQDEAMKAVSDVYNVGETPEDLWDAFNRFMLLPAVDEYRRRVAERPTHTDFGTAQTNLAWE